MNVEGSFLADVGIRGEFIAALAQPGTLNGQRTVNAGGKLVVPGGVDPHVHSAVSAAGASTLEDFAGCTRAAAYGGTTTIVDFAIPDEREHLPLAAAQKRVIEASSACVDVALHACITRVTPESIAQIPQLVQMGLRTLKMFTIYRGTLMLTLDEIRICLEELQKADGLALVHCESPYLVEPLIEEFKTQDQLEPRFHALSRPPEAEVDMVRSVIELLRATGARGYIVHVTTPEAAMEIVRARSDGVRVWAETCPQYVLLNDRVYEQDNGELWICSPPIRNEETRRRLWQLLLYGFIDIWGSDHCSYGRSQKYAARRDFTQVPNGFPGVETRCPLLFSAGISGGVLDPADFVRLTSTGPAKLNGLYPKKGRIAPGSDADLAIYNPGAERLLTAASLHSAAGYTPFEGAPVRGWPEFVMVRGRPVVEDRRFVGAEGYGEFVPAGIPIAPM